MSNQSGQGDAELARVIEEAIDKGASSAEEIHRAIGELPITVLENLGMDETATDVKRIQDRSISAIYGLIRNINHKVGSLAADLLALRDAREKGDGE